MLPNFNYKSNFSKVPKDEDPSYVILFIALLVFFYFLANL